MNEYEETKFADDLDDLAVEISSNLYKLFKRKDYILCYGALSKSLVLFGKTICIEDEKQLGIIKSWLAEFQNIELRNTEKK